MHKNLSQPKPAILGFTLVELIISVAIITIISAVGIAGFNSANTNASVKSQAQEIKTLLRKLRTDAGAAVKPAGNCAANGIVYGTYATFERNTSSIIYGTSCWDPAATTDYSTSNTFQIKQGLVQGSQYFQTSIVFFSFDGEVKFLDYSSTGQTRPTLNDILNTTSPVNYLPVHVTNGSDVFDASSVRRKVFINLNGLICDESNLNPFSSSCGL